MKYKLTTLFFALLCFSACQKEVDVNTTEDDVNTTVTEYTQSWVVPADNHIIPIAANHKSDIMEVYNFGNKEFHYYHRSEEHTSELQSRPHLVCRLLIEKKSNN